VIWLQPIRVTGTTYHLKDVTQLISEDVVLVREPVPGIHDRAIAVYAVRGDQWKQKVGYIPRGLADMVLDAQLPAEGKVVWQALPAGVAIQA
jgi:hypothetical protein